MTYLPKAFDWIPHDLLIANLSACGLNRDYLRNRKQCVQINNEQNESDTVISGVPHGSIFRPILFNIFFNDEFLFFPVVSIHNFENDNTLASFASTLEELLSILRS